LNNDQANLLASVNIPIIMVDGSLRIRRFTPPAGKLFNLVPGDVGRPVTGFKPNITIDDLGGTLKEVISGVGPKELEVQDTEGHFFMLRILPYITADNKIDGGVLVFVDVDPLRRSLRALQEQK